MTKSSLNSSSLPAHTPIFFYRWIILIVYFFIMTVTLGAMIGFRIFIWMPDMRWSDSSILLAYSLSPLMTGIGVLALGSFIYYTRRIRLIFFVSTIVHWLGLYMTSTVTTIEPFYFWYVFVVSVSRSVFFLCATVLITRWFEKSRGLMIINILIGNIIGLFIFPFFIFPSVFSWMIFMWGWQTAYMMLSFLMTILLLISCAFLGNYK